MSHRPYRRGYARGSISTREGEVNDVQCHGHSGMLHRHFLGFLHHPDRTRDDYRRMYKSDKRRPRVAKANANDSMYHIGAK